VRPTGSWLGFCLSRDRLIVAAFVAVTPRRRLRWALDDDTLDALVDGAARVVLAAASAVLAAAGGGSLSDVETTVAMTAKEAFATFESAAKAAKVFRSAGRS
jgi:hypothetical protein